MHPYFDITGTYKHGAEHAVKVQFLFREMIYFQVCCCYWRQWLQSQPHALILSYVMVSVVL